MIWRPNSPHHDTGPTHQVAAAFIALTKVTKGPLSHTGRYDEVRTIWPMSVVIELSYSGVSGWVEP